MEQAFYNLWVLYRDENNKQVDYHVYMKSMEEVQKKIERVCTIHGNVSGHVSKYIDMGSCYLMDLKFGKDGFMDYEAKYTGVVVTWENKENE